MASKRAVILYTKLVDSKKWKIIECANFLAFVQWYHDFVPFSLIFLDKRGVFSEYIFDEKA